MNFPEKNLKILACPVCRNELSVNVSDEYEDRVVSGSLSCKLCRKNFEIKDGVVYLMPNDFNKSDKYGEWEKKQELGEKAYKEEKNLYKSYSDNIAQEFARWCNFRGLILDVGCGIWEFPVYVELIEKIDNFIGIDPLKGEKKKFPFVIGVGEHLPFKDEQFDNCICATALDHVVNPFKILVEINRVLKKDGEFFLWIGIFGKNKKDKNFFNKEKKNKKEMFINALRNFRINKLPKYFLILFRKMNKKIRSVLNKPLDDLHFNYFFKDDIEKIVKKAGFKIKDKKLIDNSLFIKIKK